MSGLRASSGERPCRLCGDTGQIVHTVRRINPNSGVPAHDPEWDHAEDCPRCVNPIFGARVFRVDAMAAPEVARPSLPRPAGSSYPAGTRNPTDLEDAA